MLTLTLPPESEAYLRDRTRDLGFAHPSEYVQRLVEQDRSRTAGEAAPSASPGRRIVERLQGTATRGLTAEQIMAETRSEV